MTPMKSKPPSLPFRPDHPAAGRSLIVVALFLAGLAGPPLSAAANRTLTVAVVIPANTQLTADYPPSAVQDCATAGTDRLARLGQKNFPYLEWSPASGSPAIDAPRYSLAVTLAQKQLRTGSTIIGTETRLRFSGRIDGRNFAFDDLPPELTVLYGALDPRSPSQDPTLLKERILELLTNNFQDSGFRDKLQERFLAFIPLAAEVVPEDTLRSVVLDVPWDVLQASSKSTIKVRYNTQPPAKPAAFPVAIEIAPSDPYPDPPWNQKVVCRVLALNHPLVAAPPFWEAIMESWQAKTTEPAHVYMVHFERDYSLGTTGSLDDGEGGAK